METFFHSGAGRNLFWIFFETGSIKRHIGTFYIVFVLNNQVFDVLLCIISDANTFISLVLPDLAGYCANFGAKTVI